MNTLVLFFKAHQVLILFIGAALTFLLFIVLILFSFIKTSQVPTAGIGEPTPYISGTTTRNGFAISPDTATPLHPGSKQSFLLSLPSNISQAKILVKREDLTTNTSEEAVAFTQSIKQNMHTISLTNPILPYSSYTISVISNNTTVFTAIYLSDLPDVSPIESNSRALVPYLPHETPNYRLSFDEAENIYIFNFIYNDASPQTLDQQYDAAKNAALDFIKSKGIDPETIIVDWRYS